MSALLNDLYAALEEVPVARLRIAADARLDSPPGASSSAAVPEPDALPVQGVGPAGTNGASSGPSGIAALSSSRLRAIVTAARQNHGPHHIRWEPRQRRAWAELNRRGETA